MATIDVTPNTFTNVFFEAGEIEALVTKLVDQLGIAGDVRVEVDESTPAQKVRLVSVDPVVIAVESGALEDNKRPRHFGQVEAADALGRILCKAADHLDPDFGAPPLDDHLSLAHTAAWDTYAVGRLVRLGYAAQRQRRVYTFELRHGFTDVALAAFDQLWNTESLTWDQIVTISDETRSVIDAA